MTVFDSSRYRPFSPVPNPNRRWVDRTLTKAPVWASVDLRDGNQALLAPMDTPKKLRLFGLLVRMGFKEIEVGFPSASTIEFDFVRQLIERDMIPSDVTIQVLTQAREDLIIRSFAALKGAKKANMHFYNSVNPAQRIQVFRRDRGGVKEIAETGARIIRDLATLSPETMWTFQYSPESFSATEPDFALEVCSAVKEIWEPEKGQKVILNLPATVEMSTPNVFADQVERFLDQLPGRDGVVVSVHTHNDRGCAIAAAELALLAGADRVEGTLFGNGERTGNLDLITMAMNLYSQGVDPNLDLSFSREILSCYKECTGMPVHPRHPWFGDLVYSASSGSHQDAIRKGMALHREHGGFWTVPYLPIDPQDLGWDYTEVVRINSQSGKSGIAHVLKRDYQIELPPWLWGEFAELVQAEAERTGVEVAPSRILALFEEAYLRVPPRWRLSGYAVDKTEERVHMMVRIGDEGSIKMDGEGSGVVEALMDGLSNAFTIRAEIVNFSEHAMSEGTEAKAVAFVKIRSHDSGKPPIAAASFGRDTTEAVLQAVLTAIARLEGIKLG